MLDLIKWIIVSSRSFTAIRCKWMPLREQNKHRIDMHIRGVLIYVLLRWLILFERQGERNNGSAREGLSACSRFLSTVKCSDLISEVQGTFYKLTILPNFLIISSKPACCEHSKWILESSVYIEAWRTNLTIKSVLWCNELRFEAFLNLRIEFRVFTTTVVQIESAKIK